MNMSEWTWPSLPSVGEAWVLPLQPWTFLLLDLSSALIEMTSQAPVHIKHSD